MKIAIACVGSYVGIVTAGFSLTSFQGPGAPPQEPLSLHLAGLLEKRHAVRFKLCCFRGGWFRLRARMTAQSWFQFLIDWVGLPSLAPSRHHLLLYRRWYREFPFFCPTLLGGICGHCSSVVFWGSTRCIQGLLDLRYRFGCLAFLASYELFFKRLFPGFYKRGLPFAFSGCIILVVVVRLHLFIRWSFIFPLP